jgi:hypothetical protein
MAGPQWKDASEYCREHHVSVQDAVQRAALGAELNTHRTEALVKCAVLHRMTQLGMPEAVCVG